MLELKLHLLLQLAQLLRNQSSEFAEMLLHKFILHKFGNMSVSFWGQVGLYGVLVGFGGDKPPTVEEVGRLVLPVSGTWWCFVGGSLQTGGGG